MESFFHLMKAETIVLHHYRTREQLETIMCTRIKYNNESIIKEKLGGQSPIGYRISATEKVA
jgi:transposase InsO family protein